MAKPNVPKEISNASDFIGDHKEFGPPLFAKLVPFAVHVAASIYEERRDRLVNTNIIEELEIMTTKIHDTLQSLNLPGSLQALEKPLGLPHSITSHAEEIRQADALARLQRSFADTAKLKASDNSIFVEGKELLDAEASENERLLMKYGSDRWTRADSKSAAPKLFAQVGEIEGYLQSAANSDELVKTKFRECEEVLQILSSSDRDIGNFVPSSRRVAIPPKLEGEVPRLRNSLNEVNRLESRRRRKIEALREKAKKDDINSSILAETARLEREYPNQTVVPANFESFFEKRLKKYDTDLDDVKLEAEEQDRLTAQLEHANASFVAARKGDSSSREREQALQKLENGYFKYKEIVSNLDVGRKFYNDLAKIVGRFRDACKAFKYERREEATKIEKHVPSSFSRTWLIRYSELSLPPLSHLSLQSQSNENYQQHIPRTHNTQSTSSYSSHAYQPQGEPIHAPLPTRAPTAPMQSPSIMPTTWNPDMGIKFGGTLPQPNPKQEPGLNGQGQPTQVQTQRSGQWPGQGGTWDPNRGFKFG